MPAIRLLSLITILFLVLSGCGNNPKKDLCDGVDCEFGVCDSDSGECTNPGECSESAPCLEGYECAGGSCIATFGCEDGSCDRGVCQEGACVNPDRCEIDGDCVPGYGCDGDQCIEDQCDLVECERGVCEKATGECVNAAVCTVETEDSDCVDGFVCYDQSCADEETVCSDIDCDRGACDYEAQECVNPQMCSGDMDCLDGYFCGDDGSCQQNRCANGTNCARGVCEEATGSCVNAETCGALEDCTDGFFCIGDTCTDETTACEVCPGNQICDYDDGSLQVVCSENPDGCTTSVDCDGDRVCLAGECADPQPCQDDPFEPNESDAAATDWYAVAGDGEVLDASICQGDVDWYAYDVEQDAVFTGTLVATVTIPAALTGIADLEVELLDPDGASVGQATLPADETSVRLEYSVGNIDQGIYQLSVQEGSDVGTGGLDYQVYVDLVDENAAAACASPSSLTAGMEESGDTSMSMSNALGSSCTFDAGATEDVWAIDVARASNVTLTLDTPEWDGVISVRSQCEADTSEIACANDVLSSGTESLNLQLDPGTYFVVVQGNAGSESGAYTLNLQQEPLICTPADNSCMDADTAMLCNSEGTGFETVMCTLGCDMATGSCIREPGDVCSTAFDATGGYNGTISLAALEADYDPMSMACVPDSFGSSATVGPDAVFDVTLPAGEVVYARAEPTGFDDVSVYLVDDCTDVSNACLTGVNDDSFSGPEELVYENTTAAPLDLQVIVDSESTSTTDVEVEILTGPVVCTPGEQQCNGDDLETCNVAGTGFDADTCTFGCDTGNGACIPPPNDTCNAGAIDVSAGGQFSARIDDYADDYSDPSVCTGFSADGPDAIFTYTGTVGDIVTVTLDTPYDGSLYAVSDCGNIQGTCLAGSDGASPEEIEFVVQSADPVFIVADSFSTSPSGDFTLDVSSRAPDCTNYGEPVMCQADGMTLQYCDQIGEFADYTCASTCSGAACDMPSGDRCFDAISLGPNDSFTGSYSDFTQTVDPGVGTCILSESFDQPGPDAIFEVQLAAGELLTADLTTSAFGGSMYVLTDCGNARDACAWAAPQSDQMQFYAPTSDSYYVVVDTTSFSASDDFTLDLSTQAGFVCQPGAVTCDDQTDSLTVCDDAGTAIENVINCTNGCTSTGYCEAPTTAPDTCGDATLVTGPVRFSESHGRFADDYDPGAAMNACDLTDTDGPDFVYEVPLVANQVVDVTVDDLGATGSPNIYFATDCTDVGGSCLGSASDFSTVRAAHIATTDQTVFVFVDHSTATDGPILVDIDVRASECAPGSETCLGASEREFCSEFGTLETQDCFFGCTGGVCDPPTNDTCSMPLDITGGGTFTLPIDDYADDYDPGSGGCTGFSAGGPDAVFQFTGTENDVVTVSLSGSYDTSLYVTSSCSDTSTCIAGSDGGGTETVEFVVPSTGDYYVIADAFSSSPTGEFTLDFSTQTPICTPSQATCDPAGQNIDVCGSLGLAEQAVACDAMGCVPGERFCTTRDGERCVEAIDATAGGQFTGDYANFTDDYNMDSLASCTGFQTPGTDVAYAVSLAAGETLDATLDAMSVDTALYLVRGCWPPEDACLIGADVIGTGESISYTATDAEDLILVVDAFEFAPTGMYTLDVSIN